MRKYIAEIIGTFALVFAGTGAIIMNEETGGAVTHVGIAITFGLVLTALIYAFGEISGAHFNPAVTIAFFIVGLFPAKRIPGYIICQIIGALIASFTWRVLVPGNELLGTSLPSGTDMQSLVIEGIIAFFLMIVILHVSRGSKETGIMAGLAVGLTLLVCALFAGPISGASINPARSIGPAIASGHFTDLWVYIVGPIAGTIFAAGIWKWMTTME